MAERKALSKKSRFEVFKRDSFVCQYCGRHPPDAILVVDHIKPVADGGANDPDNLITACFDCNSGKGARALSAIPMSVAEKAAVLREHEAQIEGYNDLLTAKRDREDDQIQQIEDVFHDRFKCVFSTTFWESVRNNFVQRLDQEQLLFAAYKACSKCSKPEPAIKYFCGICWRLIKGA